MTSRFKRYLKGFQYYFVRRDFAGLYFRIKTGHPKSQTIDLSRTTQARRHLRVQIVSTPHTLFIANTLASRMRFHGMHVVVSTEMLENFHYDYCLIFGAHQFKNLPLGDKRIVFQMEQHLLSRWFTDKYLAILEKSFAVIEYASANLSFLSENKIAYPHIYKLQIGVTPQENFDAEIPKKHQILFYGDSFSSPRRMAILEDLSKEFNITIINDLFGEDLWAQLKAHRVLLNLHYLERSLLETPRIYEALSHGMRVVSEDAIDSTDHIFPESLVSFVPTGDVDLISKAIRIALDADNIDSGRFSEFFDSSSRMFNFQIDRFLLGKELLSLDKFHQIEDIYQEMPREIVVSMPETYMRRQYFVNNYGDLNIHVFDGLRHNISWLGCGMSYKYLALKFLKSDNQQIIVMEDDVILPEQYNQVKNSIYEFLSTRKGDWDVFAGLIADLPEGAEILKIDDYDGIKYITLNKMTGMVWNIYSRETMSYLAKWDPHIRDVQTNTIDRYLNKKEDLKVVVTLPFQFGHRADHRSSLWNIKNDQYEEMILDTESKLYYLVDEYLNLRPH
jgi:hypothetical protein